jgi:hypothetical protein
MQEAVDREFTWLNARVRVRDARSTFVDYHTWWFHAALRSDDCWETSLALTLNSNSLAEVEFPDPLELRDLESSAPAEDPSRPGREAATFERAAQLAQRRVIEQAASFLTRLDDRRRRDQKRLRDYYGALAREAGTPNRRTKVAPTPQELEDKKRIVQLELRRKLAELDERYQIEAVLRPIVLVRTRAPALAVTLDVQRKATRRDHVAYWNALTKGLEPLACTGCGAASFALAFSNDDVLPLCLDCAKPKAPRASPPVPR